MDCGPRADQRLGRATRPPSRSAAIAETDAADEATVVAAVAHCCAVTDRLEIHPVLLDAVVTALIVWL
jgi:hypothetical protein